MIFLNPLVLDINDPDVIEAGEFFLPYSTGFEIECDQGENYDVKNFTSIPDIMHVDNSAYEQRYRIPSGIKGIICLYRIAHQLKLNSVKTRSGIHYHIDCTDLADKGLYSYSHLAPFSSFMLKELDTWDYKGNYNKRVFNSGFTWLRLNTRFNTIECRIGEMTFDYNLLLTRITHLQGIMKVVKARVLLDYNKTHNPCLLYKREPSMEEILRSRTKKI